MSKTYFEDFPRISGNTGSSFGASIHKQLEEDPNSRFHVLAQGQVFATAHYADGSTEDRFLGDNLVVTTAGNIVAQLCRGYTGGNPNAAPAVVGVSDGPTFGITHMALGNVGPLQNPPTPQLSDTSLSSEYFRKAISQTQYINEEDGTQAALVTNVVDFITNFQIGEPAGTLTEVALYGGVDNAGNPASTGGGIMFSRRTFPVWNLDDSTAVTFTWRIFF
jgi:hypothetical protein